MPHPLEQKVRAIGRRARRLVLLHAGAWTVVVVAAAILVAGLADYLVRYQDRGVRIIVSLLVLAAAVWSVRKFLAPAARYRPSEVDVARRIERRFPQLRDRLSSSVAFLQEPEDDPRAGSADLRRAVVAETESRVEQLNLREALAPSSARRASLAALATLAVLTNVCLLDPASAALAARRLAMPWSGESWPLWNDLQFENAPRRLAKGSNFEVELIDENDRLPDDVQIQYWFQGDDPGEIETAAMKPLGDKMLARRENVTRSFRYRAVGGDHQTMPWIPLEVVEPPQVASMQILLHPPEYTGWPVEKSGMNIRALEGTAVEMKGRTEKPLRAARLMIDAEEDVVIPLALTADNHGFYLASRARPPGGTVGPEDGPARQAEPTWRITSSGAWRLVLTDATGLEGGGDTRHEVQAIPDRPPTIALDGDDAVAYVTPQAVIPVRGVVKDDLAVQSIDLRYLDSAHSDQDHQSLEIYRGPKVVGALRMPSENGTRSVPTTMEGEAHRLDYAWDLAKLSGLQPGVQLTWHVAASDYKPQEDRSPARRFLIITERELEDRIGRRHSDILTRLAETLDKQRAVRSQTTSLEIQLDETGALEPRDLDHLQSAELNQRQIQRMLSGGPEGVEAQIEALLQDMQNNRLDSPDVERRMRELLADVQALGEEHLPGAQSGLIDALKESPDAARAKLKEAGEHQDSVIAALEGMLGELSQWDNYRRIARDIHQLRRDEDDLAARTNELRMQTLGKEEKDLTAQERAGVKRLAQQQAEIARRFEQTQGRMRDMAAELEASDPVAAETLEDALDAAARMAISGTMREAGRNLESNRLGQAARQQQETTEGLDDLLNVLSNRREHELGRLVEKLREAAGDLEEKQRQLKELRKKLEQAAGQADEAEQKRQLERLSREQQQLAEEIDRLSRRLQRLRAERAGESASRSAQSLAQSGQQSQANDAEQSLESAEQAEKDLEQAEQELQQAIEQAEQDLFFEQMARLEQAIAGMIKRQQGVVEETTRLHDLQTQQGELTRGQRASVAALATVERALSEEAAQFAEKIAKAKAFEFALQGVIREMLTTASRLDRAQTGDATQQSARAALDRLDRLAEALKDDPAPQGEQESPSGQEPGEQQQRPPSDGIAAMAELKLLKLMQEELNQRTAALDEAREQQGELTPEQEQQLAELSAEQGRLAELLLNLGAATEENPEDDPESLPDPSGEGELDEELEKSLEQLRPKDLE
ncbi:MAG: hypothetical protein KY475_10005 [Planctomycetes bacterium]|nr:hypothetical protein [Planctomycetota bacterium]